MKIAILGSAFAIGKPPEFGTGWSAADPAMRAPTG
jgi:hypothetical protein